VRKWACFLQAHGKVASLHGKKKALVHQRGEKRAVCKKGGRTDMQIAETGREDHEATNLRKSFRGRARGERDSTGSELDSDPAKLGLREGSHAKKWGNEKD